MTGWRAKMLLGSDLWMRSQKTVEHVDKGQNMLLVVMRLAGADAIDNHVTDFFRALLRSSRSDRIGHQLSPRGRQQFRDVPVEESLTQDKFHAATSVLSKTNNVLGSLSLRTQTCRKRGHHDQPKARGRHQSPGGTCAG